MEHGLSGWRMSLSCLFWQHTYKNWIHTEISIAPVQEWHANSEVVHIFKKLSSPLHSLLKNIAVLIFHPSSNCLSPCRCSNYWSTWALQQGLAPRVYHRPKVAMIMSNRAILSPHGRCWDSCQATQQGEEITPRYMENSSPPALHASQACLDPSL